MQLATVPPFWQVPVTPAGMLPLASYPTDLIAPAEGTSVLASTKAFSYRPTGQFYLDHDQSRLRQQQLHVDRVDDLVARSMGRGLQSASSPPFADAAPPRHPYNPISAGDLRSSWATMCCRARLMTTKLAGRGALECLCTDLRGASCSLAKHGPASQRRHEPAALPAGTSKVVVVLPGLTSLTDIPVTSAP